MPLTRVFLLFLPLSRRISIAHFFSLYRSVSEEIVSEFVRNSKLYQSHLQQPNYSLRFPHPLVSSDFPPLLLTLYIVLLWLLISWLSPRAEKLQCYFILIIFWCNVNKIKVSRFCLPLPCSFHVVSSYNSSLDDVSSHRVKSLNAIVSAENNSREVLLLRTTTTGLKWAKINKTTSNNLSFPIKEQFKLAYTICWLYIWINTITQTISRSVRRLMTLKASLLWSHCSECQAAKKFKIFLEIFPGEVCDLLSRLSRTVSSYSDSISFSLSLFF